MSAPAKLIETAIIVVLWLSLSVLLHLAVGFRPLVTDFEIGAVSGVAVIKIYEAIVLWARQ